MTKGNQVTVDWNAKTVTVVDSKGGVVRSYGPPESGHSQATTFDPNDPQPLQGHNEVEGGRDAEALARLAAEAALPSVGAVKELLGSDAADTLGPAATGGSLDPNALRETGREGGVGEKELVNPNADPAHLRSQADEAEGRAAALRAQADQSEENREGGSKKSKATAKESS